MSRVTVFGAPTRHWARPARIEEEALETSARKRLDDSAVAAAVGVVLAFGLLLLSVWGNQIYSPSGTAQLISTTQTGQLEYATPLRESDPMHDDQLAQGCGTISVSRSWLLCEGGRPIPFNR